MAGLEDIASEHQRLVDELDRLWGRLTTYEDDTVDIMNRRYNEALRESVDAVRDTLDAVETEDGTLVDDAAAVTDARLQLIENTSGMETLWNAWRARLLNLHDQYNEIFAAASDEAIESVAAAGDEAIQTLLGQWPGPDTNGSGLAGQFYSMSTHHRRELADAVTRSVLGRESKSRLVNELEEQTDMARNQAEQRFRDSTMQYSRSVNAQKADAQGYEWYYYIGPDDDLTRPFCDMVLGEGPIWHIADIRELDNNQTGAGTVMTAGGGYNCRHHWRPIRPRWITGFESKVAPESQDKIDDNTNT